MRLIFPLAEQLNRAVTELAVCNPLNSRLALILTDNALELMCHQRCLEMVDEDRRASTPKLTFKNKAAARGRAFDAKIGLLKGQGYFSASDTRAIQILHSYRNQLYHVGLRDDPVVGPLAHVYLRLTLHHAPSLLRPVRYLQWEEGLSGDLITGFFPELAGARRFSCKVDTAAFVKMLSSRINDDQLSFKDALASHLLRLVDKLEGNFAIIAKGRSGKDDPRETLKRVQLEADTMSEIVRLHRERERILKTGGSPVEPFDPDRLEIARGSGFLIEANRKYLSNWKPRHKGLPFRGWRKQAESLCQAEDDLAALDHYARIHQEIDDLEDVLAEPIQDMHGWNQYQEDVAMDRR